MVKIFIGVIAVAFIVIIGFMVVDPAIPSNGDIGAISETAGNITGKYSIEGEVIKSGTYTLKDGNCMQDLIDAAGGLTISADERCFFPDAELKASKSYYIASRYDANDICNNQEVTKVNINNDNAQALTSINGITTSIANSIVSYRSENGGFKTLEDLLDVYGIGTATYRKIRGFVVLHE